MPTDACITQVIVPELRKGLEEQILEDIRNRDDISSANLPSAIFYTFVNTHQSLNCAAFSRTGAYVAGVKPSLQIQLHCIPPEVYCAKLPLCQNLSLSQHTSMLCQY